jgi:chromosome partitioning protein
MADDMPEQRQRRRLFGRRRAVTSTPDPGAPAAAGTEAEAMGGEAPPPDQSSEQPTEAGVETAASPGGHALQDHPSDERGDGEVPGDQPVTREATEVAVEEMVVVEEPVLDDPTAAEPIAPEVHADPAPVFGPEPGAPTTARAAEELPPAPEEPVQSAAAAAPAPMPAPLSAPAVESPEPDGDEGSAAPVGPDERPVGGAGSDEDRDAAIEAEPVEPVEVEPAEPAQASPEPAEAAVLGRPEDAAAAASVGRESAKAAPMTLPRVIAVANQKGGVGKTTTAVNLGAALAEAGYRVLVVDLDPQGNATTGLGVSPRDVETSIYDVLMNDVPALDVVEPTSLKNLFVVPATLDLAGAEIELVPAFSREQKLRRALEVVRAEYDLVLIDCPPSLGLLTVNGLAAADDVIVPIQCEYYALEGLGQLLRNVALVRNNLNPSLEVRGIVLTMHDTRTRLAEQVENEVREHFGEKVYATVVPRTVRLAEAPSFGQPIIVFDPTSKGAKAYRKLAKEVSRGATRRTG